MSEITLITAFFDIGRKKFKAIPRTNETYINNFKFWARMKNDLVIYTEPHIKNIVYSIREQYGLSERTKIIVIDNIEDIEPEILNCMDDISHSNWFSHFRVLPNATSNIPKYSYLMLLKTWFIQDAEKRGLINKYAAWIDFGFNHGGSLYTNPEEFDFEWVFEFSDKIQLFYYQSIDQKPAFEMVRRLCDSIMGCIYIVPKQYCNELWNLTKNAMLNLITMGLYDDDQMLLLMAYRAKPEIFEMHKSDWFLPLKEYGADHLSVRKKGKRPFHKQFIIDVRNQFHRIRLALRNAIITFNDLSFRD